MECSMLLVQNMSGSQSISSNLFMRTLLSLAASVFAIEFKACRKEPMPRLLYFCFA
jgi:hypothetical protein